MRSLRQLVSYPNVVSTLALVVATSGGAYAVSQLPAGSVGTAQLATGAVTAPKIRGGAVTGAKIAGNAVTGAKIKNGTVAAADLVAGTMPVSGSGAVKAGGASLPGCTDTVLASRTVTPTKTSRLVALATGSWQRNGGASGDFVQMVLFINVSQGATELGRTASAEWWATATDNASAMPIAVSGSPIVTGGTSPVALQKGTTYTVDLVASVNGTCAHSSFMNAAELTTILTDNAG